MVWVWGFAHGSVEGTKEGEGKASGAARLRRKADVVCGQGKRGRRVREKYQRVMGKRQRQSVALNVQFVGEWGWLEGGRGNEVCIQTRISNLIPNPKLQPDTLPTL